MLNNLFFDILLILFYSKIFTIIILFMIKAINYIIELFSYKDKISVYRTIYFQNIYGFINETMLKYILIQFLKFLVNYTTNSNNRILIKVVQINPFTKSYYPISDDLVFEFNSMNPITAGELYKLINWHENKFIHNLDIIILYKFI